MITRSVLSITALLAILIACTPKQQHHSDKLEALSWLQGTWQMQAPNGTIIEHWDTINDTLMQGASYFITLNNDTAERESIALTLNDTTLCYIPTVSNQNAGKPTIFKEVAYTPNEVSFENPQHDFPKRIVYRKVSAKAIYAAVSAGDKKLEFNYTKQ